jgi:hypothetical protein
LRDEKFWLKEARRQRLIRRLEAYSVSLLPHLNEEAIRREIEEAHQEVYELDHEDEIEAIEKKARARLGELRKPRPPVKRKKRVKHGKTKRRI